MKKDGFKNSPLFITIWKIRRSEEYGERDGEIKIKKESLNIIEHIIKLERKNQVKKEQKNKMKNIKNTNENIIVNTKKVEEGRNTYLEVEHKSISEIKLFQKERNVRSVGV